MNNHFTFPKEERIFLQKEIDLLFSEGNSFMSYPLRVVYVEKKPESGASAAILLSVPKKKFKRAVKRNRIKRLIRESYRLNKIPFIESLVEKDKGLLIAFLFVGDGLPIYDEIEKSVKKALSLLIGRLQ